MPQNRRGRIGRLLLIAVGCILALAATGAIYVPASIGGLTVEMFARRHPDRVAGMVFLDAANSIALERAAPLVTRTMTLEACLATVAARLGALRLIDPFELRREPTEAAARTVSRLYRVEPMATLCGIVRGVQTTLAEFRAAPPLNAEIPLTVLIAETNEKLGPPGFAAKAGDLLRERPDLMKAFSRRSTRGVWHVVAGSDHVIASSQPRAVAAAVLEMISRR